VSAPIITLGDIVERFDLLGFYSLTGRLRMVQSACSTMRNAPNQNLDCSLFIDVCEQAAGYCNTVGFRHSSLKAVALMGRLKHNAWNFNASAVEAEFRSLEDDISLDLCEHRFVRVEQKLVRYFDAKELFGAGVARAFPSAAQDVSEAGSCLAIGTNAAAVFHLMHVVEWGMRSLARNLKLLRVVVDRKKGKTTPVEYAQWEHILNQLHGKVEEKVQAITRGPRKQKAQEFYYSALKEIEGFKEAWRNHIMHTRQSYSSEDALAVLSHVERFMKSLAEFGIGEGRMMQRK